MGQFHSSPTGKVGQHSIGVDTAHYASRRTLHQSDGRLPRGSGHPARGPVATRNQPPGDPEFRRPRPPAFPHHEQNRAIGHLVAKRKFSDLRVIIAPPKGLAPLFMRPRPSPQALACAAGLPSHHAIQSDLAAAQEPVGQQHHWGRLAWVRSLKTRRSSLQVLIRRAVKRRSEKRLIQLQHFSWEVPARPTADDRAHGRPPAAVSIARPQHPAPVFQLWEFRGPGCAGVIRSALHRS